MGSHPRFWSAVAQLMRLNALLLLAAALVVGLPRIWTSLVLGVRTPGEGVALLVRDVTAVALILGLAALLWTAKSALVAGKPLLVRILVGSWLVIATVSTAGFTLIALGAAYFITRPPYARPAAALE